MTFVSYAQNFEDVLLWRALKDVPVGFYIDVGASHPDNDSVTRAFFDRGWHGINIEPGVEDARRIAAARPGDITLQVAAGRADGETDFYTVSGTGLSTIDPEVAAGYRERNWELPRSRVGVRTLAGICRAHVRQDIHFLKIDVEGAEGDVLAGADLVAYRPWIILVEATAPLSTRQTHDEWEPGLIGQGYRFAWFDGLNRFYLAEEHAEALSVHFRTPPNVFDDFIRASDTLWAARVATTEARAGSLERNLAASEKRAAEAAAAAAEYAEYANHEIARLQQLSWDQRQQAANLESRLKEELHYALHEVQQTHLRLQAALREQNERTYALEHTLGVLRETDAARAELEAALHRSEAWLDAVRRSTSWRLTGPVRVALRRFGHGNGTTHAAVPQAAPPMGAEPLEVSQAPVMEPAPEVAQAQPEPPDAPIALPDGFLEVVPPPPAARLRPGRHRGCVHQFHSGSAVADAITNAMLLTRGILRGLGYASEIFVTHRDPLLAHEMRLIDELPTHDGYVLILRHSMGHDAFEQIAALPAPKVLMYHNITPPELLTRHPSLAAYAALGRVQLAALPGHVHASLADSEYNAIELRQLGFDPVRSCTLLFDIAPILARAEAGDAADRRDGVFTILFVGRLCQSKGQVELVEAYARFRALGGPPARLVLVGRHDGEADPYMQALRRAIAATGHPDEIRLTGLLSDAGRDAWYGRADLYVSLSRHEGFGVPLVEAMAHGVPVLARPSGAVPYTLGDAACLLPEDANPDRTGAILHALAIDPRRRAAQAEAQRASLDRFALPGQTAILVQALLRAGAALPPGPRDALDANLRFALTGHVNKTYSLAAVNRDLARELEAARPGRVRVIPVESVITTNISEVPEESRAAVAALVDRPAPLSAPEVIISHHYPVYVPPRMDGQIRLAMLFWEESLLPSDTIATLEGGFDGVVAPTRFVAHALQDSGLRLPVRVIDHAPALASFRALRHGRKPPGPLTFLHVSSCFPRKGADVLLRAWSAAFTAADPVRLLIKSFPNRHNSIAADLVALRRTRPDLAPIILIDQDLDEAAMAGLYAQADVMVLPSRGEGYNLPAAEALAAGLRLIVTGAGGHMDFCRRDDPRIRLLRYRHAVSASHLAVPCSLWLEPDPDDLAAALREALVQPVPTLAPWAKSLPVPPKVDVALSRFALDLLLQPHREPVRVGWVSSWSQKCGVAEYSRLLLGALEPDPDLSITVLCDHRTPAYAPLPGNLEHIPCWQDDMNSMDELLGVIARTDMQVVAVQHQPGLIPWPSLKHLIAGVVGQGRILTLTLHNTRDLFDLPQEQRADLVVALARADRVIVHTLADLDRLTGLGLAERVTLFPQGLPAPMAARPPRVLDEAGVPVIGCYGFFLPGKGIDTLIEAAVRLRGDWPGLQLRLVNAAYDAPASLAEIARGRQLAEPLGEAVQFHTGFLPHGQSLALLADCDLIVLPYQPSKEASSAAMRTALTTLVPVAVSRIALFDEAEDAVLRVDAGTAESLAGDLDRLLRDAASRWRVQRDAAGWMQARAWPPIARRLTGLLTGLVRSRS